MKQDYALQYALSYTAASEYQFNVESIQWYEEKPQIIAKDSNTLICIDASNGVVDPSCFWVWAAKEDGRFYWVDGTVRKLDPSKPEFHDEIFRLVKYWETFSQRVIQIRVEQMGNQTWAALIASELRSRGIYHIPVVPCKDPGKKTGQFSTGKLDRIYRRWAPLINKGSVVFPRPRREGGAGIMSAMGESGTMTDLVDYFLINELTTFPACRHEDMLDAGGLIEDERANQEYPVIFGKKRKINSIYSNPSSYIKMKTTWMSNV
jgi:hypothetical protein